MPVQFRRPAGTTATRSVGEIEDGEIEKQIKEVFVRICTTAGDYRHPSLLFERMRERVADGLGIKIDAVRVSPLRNTEVNGEGKEVFVVDGESSIKREEMAYCLSIGERHFLMPQVLGGWWLKGTNSFANLSGFKPGRSSINTERIRPDNLKGFRPARLVKVNGDQGADQSIPQQFVLTQYGMVVGWDKRR